MVLLSFGKFIGVVSWFIIFGSFIFRINLYVKLYKTLKKYPKEFEPLGIDRYLLFVPEFCNFKKIKKMVDMSNYEITTVIKKLNISKYTLFGSIILFCLIVLVFNRIEVLLS
ncbi:MAG: hypothetical protein J6S91_13665 [Treponema sp.]|nr:hypothetical protein [Treponema sp.]